MRVPWLIHAWALIHSYMCHDSCVRMYALFVCHDSCVRMYDSFIHVPWLICTHVWLIHIRTLAYSYMCHDSFARVNDSLVYVFSLILFAHDTCMNTHLYEYVNEYMCLALFYLLWLIHEYVKVHIWMRHQCVHMSHGTCMNEYMCLALFYLLWLIQRGGGLGSSTIVKKFNETYAPS